MATSKIIMINFIYILYPEKKLKGVYKVENKVQVK